MKNTCKLCDNLLSEIKSFGGLAHIQGCFRCNIYLQAKEVRLNHSCLFFLFKNYYVYVNLDKNYSFIHNIHNLYNRSILVDEKLELFTNSRLGKLISSYQIKNIFIPSSEDDIKNFLILI